MPNATLTGYAKAMDRDSTELEKRLWRRLSNSQLSGLKFRRQAAIEPLVVDFLCPEKALIVEIDGDTHDDPTADARRDAWLLRRGYRTVRFTNADVMDNIEGVLQAISSTALEAPDRWPGCPHPNPSPEGEGLGVVHLSPPPPPA